MSSDSSSIISKSELRAAKRKEQEAKRKDNAERYRALAAKFPGVWLHIDTTSPKDVPMHITVGLPPGQQEIEIKVTHNSDWQQVVVSTEYAPSIDVMAQLLLALTCRYNARVADANQTVLRETPQALITLDTNDTPK
jgi:hypothetical protein